jgi:hypothetical protein
MGAWVNGQTSESGWAQPTEPGDDSWIGLMRGAAQVMFLAAATARLLARPSALPYAQWLLADARDDSAPIYPCERQRTEGLDGRECISQ